MSVLSAFTFVNRLLAFKPGRDPESHKQERCALLRQFTAARDLHTRQLILDKMMSEDLLCGADLNTVCFNDIHLEGANLEAADLCHATLSGADLESANLQRARLSETDLNNAELMNANMSGAELTGACLDGARLANAQLNGANLQSADLRGASLYAADLEAARLDAADLRGCCLRGANLHQASLNRTLFDENTILPDGEQWKPDVEMQRFTDDSHPDYSTCRISILSVFETASLTT